MFCRRLSGACLEHFQWGHAGALPPNGVAASDPKKKLNSTVYYVNPIDFIIF